MPQFDFAIRMLHRISSRSIKYHPTVHEISPN
jgi:hypothetical protein